MKTLILGTRTLALEIADIASDIAGTEVAGFVENLDRSKCDQLLQGLPVYWIDDVVTLVETHWAVCALGTTQRSKFTQQAEALGLRFTTLVHPSAHVSKRSSLGVGSVVSAGSIIATDTIIGRHVIANRGALIGHHTTIGDHVSVMPGANIAGCCRVGQAAYIGMGAVVLDHISVGEYAVIAAGSVVTRDVPPRVQVMGVPARIVKEGMEGR